MGRSTLVELRGVLSALAEEPSAVETLTLAPTPRLRDADRLVGELKAAGLDVDFRLDGDPDSLPTGVDLASYRVLQEALTNTLRHAADSHVTARVAIGTDDVVIDIGDTGAGRPVVVNGTGRGLAGMRERVRLYGGDITAQPDGLGFRVHARIPVPDRAAVPR